MSFIRCKAAFFAVATLTVALAFTSGPAAAAAPEIVQIESGDYFSCALDADGDVWCWGLNQSGQLGDGTITDRNVAAVVPGLPRIRAIAVGGSHVCALSAVSRVLCWGGNWSGQLGNGETSDIQTSPVPVLDLRGVTAITAGGGHSCAIDSRNRAWCWGENFDGQLGIGSTESMTVRARITALNRFETIAAGDESTCGTTSNSIEACWGRNSHGQLGDGTEIDRNEPAELVRDNLEGFGLGAFHTCAVNLQGRAFCWGSNQWGNLGDGTTERSDVPVRVGGGQRFALITAGRYHTCALTQTDRAFCWGSNDEGQLGDATQTERRLPRQVFGSRLRFTQISAGNSHSCALRRDARVMCWGNNRYGQLGNRSDEDMFARPVLVRFP